MSNNIKVAVRMRPLDEAKNERWATGMSIHGRRLTLGPRTFDPDVLLGTDSQQPDVYEHCAAIVEGVCNGSNGTILVYGQTGTGKTHTMLGGLGDNRGIAFRAIESLLENTTGRVLSGGKVALSLTMLEIYNEKVTDMLEANQPELVLFGGFPHAAKKIALATIEQAVKEIERGLSLRHVSQTAMNDRSSRSHVIIMLHLEEETEAGVEVARLFLVDLAGSESLKKSQAVGRAIGEAGAINKSLLALKSVVLALSSTADASRIHVPYRDSKLTELLQDSIGGSARTMIVACISPVGRDVEETKSTLDYASRARTIKNVSNTERDKLVIRLRSLEMEVQKLRNQLFEKINERGGVWVSKEEYDRFQNAVENNIVHRSDMERMAEMLQDAQARTTIVESQVEIFRQRCEMLDTDLFTARSAQTSAIQKLETTAADLKGLVDEHCAATVRASADDSEKLAAVFQSLQDKLCGAELVDVFSRSVDTICTDLSDFFSGCLPSVIGAHERSMRAVADHHECSASLAADAFAEINRFVVAKSQEMNRTLSQRYRDLTCSLSTAMREAEGAVEGRVRVGREPLVHVIEGVSDHVCSAVRSAAPTDGAAPLVNIELSRSREAFLQFSDDVSENVRALSQPPSPMESAPRDSVLSASLAGRSSQASLIRALQPRSENTSGSTKASKRMRSAVPEDNRRQSSKKISS